MTTLSSHAGGSSPALVIQGFNDNIGALLDSVVFFWAGNKDNNAYIRGRGLVAGTVNSAPIDGDYIGGDRAFDGIDDYIYWDPVPEVAFDGSQPFSVTLNGNFSVSANEPLVAMGADCTHAGIGWLLMRNLTTDFYLQITAAPGYATDQLQCYAASAFTGGQFSSAGVSYNGGKDQSDVLFSSNGLTKSVSPGANTLVGNATPGSNRLYIAYDSAGIILEGRVNQVIIFDRDLSQTELNRVTSHMLLPYLEVIKASCEYNLGFSSPGDAVAADIAIGKIAWVNGQRIVGTAV